MSQEIVRVGDVVYEIGNPTKFVVVCFDGAGVVLDIVMDSPVNGRVLRNGMWTGIRTLCEHFVVAGRWNFKEDKEDVDEN